MTTIQVEQPSIVRGSLKPDLQVTIADEASDANFAVLTPAMVTVTLEMNGSVVASGNADAVTPAPDGKSAIVKRAWHLGETDTRGRMWVTVEADWPGDKPQTFPATGALRLDVERAAGDA